VFERDCPANIGKERPQHPNVARSKILSMERAAYDQMVALGIADERRRNKAVEAPFGAYNVVEERRPREIVVSLQCGSVDYRSRIEVAKPNRKQALSRGIFQPLCVSGIDPLYDSVINATIDLLFRKKQRIGSAHRVTDRLEWDGGPVDQGITQPPDSERQ